MERKDLIANLPLDVSPFGADFTIEAEDLLDGHEVRFDLSAQRGMVGGFEDNRKGLRMLFLRGGQDAVIPAADDGITCRVRIDLGPDVAWNHLGCGLKGRLQKMAGQGAAIGIPVNSLTRIIGVKGNDAIELFGSQILLKKPHLGIFLITPKATIEIFSREPRAQSLLESPRIADGINEEFVKFSQGRLLFQRVKQLHRGDHARLFITMDARKNSNAVNR